MKLKSQGPGYQNCNSEIDHIKVPNVLEFQNSSLSQTRKNDHSKISISTYSDSNLFRTFSFKIVRTIIAEGFRRRWIFYKNAKISSHFN